MTISTASNPGIEVETAAKESVGNASTLGSPASTASNNVIVPDAITANNEGNLESSPSYVGRMFILRPWEHKLIGVEILDGGTGYTASDVLTISGGTAGPGGAPQITVSTVSASPSGAITAVTISREASFELRHGISGSPSPPLDLDTSPIGTGVTGGTGTGALFRFTYAPHWEMRYITEDNSNTLTVHEDWDVAPVSGDNWAVSYILGDVATVTGCTFRAQSGVYECSRRVWVGQETHAAATRRGLLSMTDGVQIELDNQTNNTESLVVSENGALFIGYEQGGVSVNGAYISTSGNATTGPSFSITGDIIYPFGITEVHDLQIRSPRENLGLTAGNGVNVTELEAFQQMTKEGNVYPAVWKNVKTFDVAINVFIGVMQIRDWVFQTTEQGLSSTGILIPLVAPGGPALVDIDGMSILAPDATAGSGQIGIETTRPAAGSPFSNEVTIESIRNLTFVNSNYVLVAVKENERWRFVNPKWNVSLDNQDQIDFEFNNDTETVIEVLFSLEATVLDVDRNAIVGAHCYIFEGTLNDDLPTENTNQSDTDANGDYVSDVLLSLWRGTTLTSPHSVNSFDRGNFALKVYDYGNTPISLNIDADGTATTGVNGQEFVLTMIADPAITQANQATALAAISPNPVIQRHSAADTIDTLPVKVLNYDGGNGAQINLGDTIISLAVSPFFEARVIEHLGDGVSGILVLDFWNGNELSDGVAISNGSFSPGSPIWTAVTDTAGLYEEFTWTVDAQGASMSALYDYLAARMAEDPLASASGSPGGPNNSFEDVLIWGGRDAAATQLLFLGSDGYFTVRNVSRTEGVWILNRGAGTIDYFTSDDGTQVTPPVEVNVTITNIQPGTEIRVYPIGSPWPTTQIAGIESTGSPSTFTFSAEAGLAVRIVVHNVQYVLPPANEFDFIVPSSDTSFPVSQIFDRNYNNP